MAQKAAGGEYRVLNGVVHKMDGLLPGLVPGTMWEVVNAYKNNTGELSTILDIIEASGFSDTLDIEDKKTYFFPVNAVFENETQFVTALLKDENKDLLFKFVLCHILDSQKSSRTLQPEEGENVKVVQAVGGESLNISDGSGVTVTVSTEASKANVILSDMLASNGVSHLINGYLMPTSFYKTISDLLEGEENLSQVATAAKSNAAFKDLTSMMTVFVPTDLAIAEFLQSQKRLPNASKLTDFSEDLVEMFISAHTTNETIKVDDLSTLDPILISIEKADMRALNGVAHSVNKVILTKELEDEFFPDSDGSDVSSSASSSDVSSSASSSDVSSSASSSDDGDDGKLDDGDDGDDGKLDDGNGVGSLTAGLPTLAALIIAVACNF